MSARVTSWPTSTVRCISIAPPLLFTGRRTAELIKYAANAFLAMKVTFINEMADLCERAGADVQEVALGVGLDNRIGAEIPERRAWVRRIVLSQGRSSR